MKKFRYSMENILKLKIKMEDQAKISYAIARNRLNKEEEKLQRMEEKKAFYEEEKRNPGDIKIDILKMKQLSEAIEIMKWKIKQQMAVVRAEEQRLEVERIRLNKAMVERKTQEKLKEKALQEYMMEYEAYEQKEIDERNSFIYGGLLLHEEDR